MTTADATRATALPGLQVAGYQSNRLHADPAIWVEKNCYVDVWIEILHALGLEPLALMSSALTVDFEGDQWTFFKPPLSDLRMLYGIDVQEFTVWRPLLEHAKEQLGAGKLISTEADAFWLPDAAGTDYRRQHTKTTIVLNDLDLANERLGYFHNTGYHSLEGEDFRNLLRVGMPHDPTHLPLYAELIRLDRLTHRPPSELAALSDTLLRTHFEHRPATNPLRRFGERITHDLPALQSQGLDHYHAWAFATIRQCGAAFDLAASHLRWQSLCDGSSVDTASASFEQIALGCKAMILKVARAVNTGRAINTAAMIEDMAQAWDEGMHKLKQALAR